SRISHARSPRATASIRAWRLEPPPEAKTARRSEDIGKGARASGKGTFSYRPPALSLFPNHRFQHRQRGGVRTYRQAGADANRDGVLHRKMAVDEPAGDGAAQAGGVMLEDVVEAERGAVAFRVGVGEGAEDEPAQAVEDAGEAELRQEPVDAVRLLS